MLTKIFYLLLIFNAVLLPLHAQFQISSTAFPTGANIPEKYTAFKGSNINPPLKWSNKPAGTQSFLLVMYDRTFCSGRADSICRSHWVVKDIPSAATGIDEGTSSTGPLPAGALLGKSDNAIRGLKEYTGPFPDSTTIHLYEFKLYALNVASLNCVTPYYNVCLQRAMEGKVLGTASLFGYYLPKPFSPLPVNFVTVEALCSNGKINCKWSTAAESANAQTFTIQRSHDGSNYISIGSIPCTGNTSTLHEYNFTDSSNNSGSGYYRIKQTDKDGRSMYSYVAYGKCGSGTEETLTVLPNPSPDKFIVSFNNPKKKQLLIMIYDMLGKQIASYKSTQQNGTFTVLANNAPGNYLLKASFNDGEDFITQKLLKLK
jgi:Raf kinase inhibitor-like YbhB/YbcL family protein